MRLTHDLLDALPLLLEVAHNHAQEHLSDEERVEGHAHEQVEEGVDGRDGEHLADQGEVAHVNLVRVEDRRDDAAELEQLRAEHDVARDRAREKEDQQDDQDVDDVLASLV